MITIYTDGSFRASENCGGYGVVAFNDNNELIYAYQEQVHNVTNNIMELQAILHATDFIDENCPDEQVTIYSDSSYAVNSINVWSAGWAANGWINSKKEPVKNLGLIQSLYFYFTKNFQKCQIVYLKGHNENLGNELADALATHDGTKFKALLEKNHVKVKI